MQQLTTSSVSTTTCQHILFVSQDALLGLDLNEALSVAGMPPMIQTRTIEDAASRAMGYRAVIVDLGELDDVPTHIEQLKELSLPMIVIADTDDVVRALDLDANSWFIKPLSADLMILRVLELIGT
ncbi:MAG: hypothetical protein ABI832_08020 [bacterium]